MYYGLFGLLVLALWLFCLVDVITADEWAIRNLSKTSWLLIVLFLPTVGSVIWLVAGRPQHATARRRPGDSPFPEYDRPGRHVPVDPAADAEFLRRCRERAEEQRRIARERKQSEG
ncbi:PLD nuclease N-terminal domain-containing protein [Phytomonospora sp. NPDC050363]|uniref:PLD nuclease N-terminal domain-containing protein n=1 Tax=Phytomonospora sp. NPDC050363 TaxID=3155642 RepID=UPI0033E1372F